MCWTSRESRVTLVVVLPLVLPVAGQSAVCSDSSYMEEFRVSFNEVKPAKLVSHTEKLMIKALSKFSLFYEQLTKPADWKETM